MESKRDDSSNGTVAAEGGETVQILSVSVACQTEPNLIDKLIDQSHTRKQSSRDEIDLYQEYVRNAQCAQFWPLDKNPIRSLVPAMVKVDLPEQHLKNESLMFDLVQAITNNSKLVNLLAKYIHHIVPNVIISKRIDLIPLITCTIRVCRDTNEQERLISLLFNLIKRPNEEQRRMILSGMIVVLQVSPHHQSSSLLLPNLWDHVNDKFPERRILLAESCATLAHYVRPVMRTNLILSILMQLLKDKSAPVRSAACKSFACLLTLIMDRNDEVFDACLSATEDIIQDVLQQTPVNFCEHRYELEQMRFCALETVYPLLCMWAVKLNRFKVEQAELYLAKAESYFAGIGLQSGSSGGRQASKSPPLLSQAEVGAATTSTASSATAKRRSLFFETSRQSYSMGGIGASHKTPASNRLLDVRRQSAYVTGSGGFPQGVDSAANSAQLTAQRAIGAYLKMLDYMIPFVFSDAVYSCAWLSKSKLNLASGSGEDDSPTKPDCQLNDRSPSIGEAEAQKKQSFDENNNNNNTNNGVHFKPEARKTSRPSTSYLLQLFDRPLNFANKLLDPTLIVDDSAIVAFHDQLEQEHMIESLDWILGQFLPKYLSILSHLSSQNFQPTIGATTDIIQEFLVSSISSVRQLCLLFGKHLTRNKIRPLIKNYTTAAGSAGSASATMGSGKLFFIYIASLTSFEPIEQQEFEEISLSIRQNLNLLELNRNDVEILAMSIKIIATNSEQIHSPSTRQKFLIYILDALASYSNQIIRTSTTSSETHQKQPHLPGSFVAAIRAAKSRTTGRNDNNSSDNKHHHTQQSASQQTQTKEFMLIIFRHILTCLIDQSLRPTDWAHILVTKFLPLLISLANDSADVHVCTYARLMCAQLVETFDTYLQSPKLTKQTADAILPALSSLKSLTEQIKASNLRRQIEYLIQNLNDTFFRDDNNNGGVTTSTAAAAAADVGDTH